MADNPETRRLTASEREALIRLAVAQEILTDAPADLRQRARMIRGASRDLAMMAKKIAVLLEGFDDTIPTDQLRTYNNSLRMASYTIGVKGPAGNGRRDDQFGMWLPYSVLNALLEGCHDKCLMCEYDRWECRRCELRKALDTVPNDTPDDDSLGCKYKMVM